VGLCARTVLDGGRGGLRGARRLRGPATTFGDSLKRSESIVEPRMESIIKQRLTVHR
jgi:hypothetical protein